jgi:hypothetical protein
MPSLRSRRRYPITPDKRGSRSYVLRKFAEPVDLDLYRIRRRAQVGGLINEYRLVA